MATNSVEYTEILDDKEVKIGDGAERWESDAFNLPDAAAVRGVLFLKHRGLTSSSEPAVVKINEYVVAKIAPRPELSSADRENAAQHWHTEIYSVQPAAFQPVKNHVVIKATPLDPARNAFDDFEVSNIVLFWRRER